MDSTLSTAAPASKGRDDGDQPYSEKGVFMAEGLLLAEQRRQNRRELLYYLRVTDRQNGEDLGRMADIHGQGMLILGDKPLEIGLAYQADLELHKTLIDQGVQPKLPLDFEAVWSRPGPRNSTYQETGVRFLNLDADGLSLIRKLIDIFSMPSAKSY